MKRYQNKARIAKAIRRLAGHFELGSTIGKFRGCQPSTLFIAGVFALLLVIAGCGKDENPVDPGNGELGTENPPLSLLLTKVGVSIVLGGTENITVTATDKNGEADNVTVQTSDASIVTASTVGNTQITLKGAVLGEAVITVTSGSGVQRQIPVRVYDPRVMDVGDLLITFTDKYEFRWNDQGTGGNNDGNFWHPMADNASGWYALGSIGRGDYQNPNEKQAVILVKENVNNPGALMPPSDYQEIWADHGSGGNNDGSFWLPLAPAGSRRGRLLGWQRMCSLLTTQRQTS